MAVISETASPSGTHPAQPQPAASWPALSPWTPLEMWHLLSLDAPTVAVVWLLYFSRQTRIALSPPTPFALFFAVWILYAADRLLDARLLGTSSLAAHLPLHGRDPLAAEAELELRHQFHHEHRPAFRVALAGVGTLLALLIPALPRHTLQTESGLAFLLLFWLVAVHGPAMRRADPERQGLPKEWVVGIFFALAIVLPFTPRLVDLRGYLPEMALLDALCTLNCLFLYRWEHPVTDAQNVCSATRWAARHLVPLTLATLLAALLAHAGAPTGSASAAWALAVLLGTGLLLLLHAGRHRLAPLRLRALADLVLLTPVPLALLARMGHG